MVAIVLQAREVINGHSGPKGACVAANVNIRTVILYDCRKVQPGTLEKIAEARNGEFIPVEPDEFYGFTQLVIHDPEMKKAVKRVKPDPPSESALDPLPPLEAL
jgi:hypothetical protein